MERILIQLNRPLFTNDPDIAFTKKRGIAKGLLHNMWHKHFVMEYTFQDLQEFYAFKTKKPVIDRKNLSLWLRRVEVWKRAKMALDAGAKECTPEFFGDLSEFVLQELKKRGNK